MSIGTKFADRRMICRCSPEGDAAADETRRRVIDALRVVDERWLVTAIVQDMWANWSMEVDSIPTDMWSAVKFVTYEGKPDRFEVRVECDLVEDGFVECYRLAAHHYWGGLKHVDERAAEMRHLERG